MEKNNPLGSYQPRDVVQVPYLWILWSIAYGASCAVGLRWLAVLTTPKFPAAVSDIDWAVLFQPMFSWSQALEGTGLGCLFAFGLWLIARVVFRRRSSEHRNALFLFGLMCAVVGIVIVVFAPGQGSLISH